jgi:hypothetical protein
MGGRRKPESADSVLAVIEEAQRQGKIRAVRDVIVMGNIRWQRIKLHVAKHDGWRKLMASIPFDENKDWRRTAHLRTVRSRPLYLKLVAELEAKGVPQPQASWQAVDTITDRDRAERYAMGKATRERKLVRLREICSSLETNLQCLKTRRRGGRVRRTGLNS